MGPATQALTDECAFCMDEKRQSSLTRTGGIVQQGPGLDLYVTARALCKGLAARSLGERKSWICTCKMHHGKQVTIRSGRANMATWACGCHFIRDTASERKLALLPFRLHVRIRSKTTRQVRQSQCFLEQVIGFHLPIALAWRTSICRLRCGGLELLVRGQHGCAGF